MKMKDRQLLTQCFMALLVVGLASPTQAQEQSVAGDGQPSAAAALPSNGDAALELPADEPVGISGLGKPGLSNTEIVDEFGQQPLRREDIIPRVLSDQERRELGNVRGRFKLSSLTAPATTLPEGSENRTPESFLHGERPLTEALPEGGGDRDADWHWSVCNWAAANTFSNPRYFEDRMLERHGHERFGHFQSAAAGARFFTTIPMLPYLWAVSNPCDCEYTLGYYRPGSCAPVMMQRPPYEKRAVIAEAAAVTGAIIAFP